MYMSQSALFSVPRSPKGADETKFGDKSAGVDEPTEVIDGAVRLMLESREARRERGTPQSSANAQVAQLATEREQDMEFLNAVMNVTPIRTRPAPTVTLHALQEWEGHVIEINEKEFTARILDLTANATFEEEEADIPFEELSDDELGKLRIGSIFRWVIGYQRSVSGTKKRVSQIVFRDLPAITKSDLQAGDEWANYVATAFAR